MIARAVLSASFAVFSAGAVLTQAPAETLPPTAERTYRAVSARFDERDAMSVVSFMDQYWRMAGNPGFNASIDHIRERLVSAGYSAASGNALGHVRVDEFPNSGRGWDYRVGTVEFEGASE